MRGKLKKCQIFQKSLNLSPLLFLALLLICSALCECILMLWEWPVLQDWSYTKVLPISEGDCKAVPYYILYHAHWKLLMTSAGHYKAIEVDFIYFLWRGHAIFFRRLRELWKTHCNIITLPQCKCTSILLVITGVFLLPPYGLLGFLAHLDHKVKENVSQACSFVSSYGTAQLLEMNRNALQSNIAHMKGLVVVYHLITYLYYSEII